jgi:hypothetical protein
VCAVIRERGTACHGARHEIALNARQVHSCVRACVRLIAISGRRRHMLRAPRRRPPPARRCSRDHPLLVHLSVAFNVADPWTCK